MNKQSKLWLCTLAACILLSGCSGKETETTAAEETAAATTTATTAESSSETESSEIKVSSKNLSEKTFLEDGSDIIVAAAEIRFPTFEGDSEALMNINSYYDNLLEKNTVYFRGEFTEMARENYKFTQDNGTIFNQFSIRSDFWVACSDDNYVSVVRDYDEASGGAVSHTTLACDNFDAKTGGKLTLSDLFSVNEELYLKKLLPIIEEQAKEKTDLYTNYESLLETTLNKDNFYIVDEDGEKTLFIVYQPYDIAPGNIGVIDFAIPFSDLKEILK